MYSSRSDPQYPSAMPNPPFPGTVPPEESSYNTPSRSPNYQDNGIDYQPPHYPSPSSQPGEWDPGANFFEASSRGVASDFSPGHTAPNTHVPPGFTYTGHAPHHRDPLNPLPDAFNRPPNPSCTYYPLSSPIHLPSKNRENLTEGFVPILPAPQELLAHDVLPADFSRLLEDCHLMGKLSLMEKVGAEILPEFMSLAPGMGFFVTHALKGKMATKKVQSAEGLVEVWDETFFRPRGLTVRVQVGKDDDAHEHVEQIHHGEEVGIGGRRRRGRGEGGMSRLEMRRQERREHGGMRGKHHDPVYLIIENQPQ
ncbi:uncharacterized protein STEHIDRAFT_160515 [Stereum hirsutum FP-91666 SS1]|uniref:uncharacterized protein n=1 Tax=Stereum hirsutum (strain FP-91666) TaxID=721885 RepID=UPI000444930A|nr:uncharacterized protein STEHIDRAFT_160515 [Stereum hirsutum FP-91666 SS1]EIM82898.1 hypothetical protein STEHIDRAFT_160515 [Stereum hirsutum FP-91666 SS1]